MKGTNNIYGSLYDSSIVNALKDIDKQIDENTKKMDNDTAMRLRQAKMLKGLELNYGGWSHNPMLKIPY